jgi:hypothetical protein
LQCGTVVQGPGKRARIQRVVYGERLTAARGSAEMTPAAEMCAAVKMRAAMTAAAMTTAVMTPTVSAAVMASAMSTAVSTAMASTVTTATFRRGMFCGRQRGRQDHDGDRNIEL